MECFTACKDDAHCIKAVGEAGLAASGAWCCQVVYITCFIYHTLSIAVVLLCLYSLHSPFLNPQDFTFCSWFSSLSN